MHANYSDLVVTIVEKKERAGAGDGGVGGSDGAGARAGSRKTPTAAAVPRTGGHGATGAQCELLDVFCAFQHQGEHITFESMDKSQRIRIMNQLEDFEERYQVTLLETEKKSRAKHSDLVVTIVEKKEGAGAGEAGVGGSHAAGARAGPRKTPAGAAVARTGGQGATGAPAGTAAYLTILKLSLAADAKVAALKGLLWVEQDECILQVFSNSWETGKRWSRLADRLLALEQ